MFVGVCRVALHLPGNSSLKGKRRVVRGVVDRTRAKFNAAVAEVADNDSLRRAVIGVAVIGNESSHVSSMIGKIAGYVEWLALAPVTTVETEVIPLGGEIGTGPAAPAVSTPAWDEDGGGGDEEEEEW